MPAEDGSDFIRRHNYEYEVDPLSDTAPARVVRMVGQHKRVLEIGSGPGAITRVLCRHSECRITALEIDPDAVRLVAPYCEKIYQADLNDEAWPSLLLEDKFDVVVAADVLEHVYAPLSVLVSMKNLLNESGYLVVSLPHVGHGAIMACLLNEDFEYHDYGLLDRSHIRFFGIKNMQSLFAQAKLKIIQAEFVIRHPEVTELAYHWRAMSSSAREMVLSNPFGMVYQVVIKAVPCERDGQAVSLMDLDVISPPSNMYLSPYYRLCQKVKRWARQHLSAEIRHSIRKILDRCAVKI